MGLIKAIKQYRESLKSGHTKRGLYAACKIGLWVSLYSAIISNYINGCDFSFKRCQKVQSPTKIERRIERTEKKEDKKKRAGTYALLINGRKRGILDCVAFRNFSRDLKNVYDSFLEAGIPESQIYVLDSQGKTEEIRNYFEPTEKGLDDAIEELSKRVGPADNFMLYVTNHGDKSWYPLPIGESRLLLEKTELTESELEERLKKIKPNYSIMVFSQCFSGGFAERLGRGNNIAIANSKSSRTTKGFGTDKLTKYFFPALFAHLTPEESERADKNKDRRISVEEAFDYSVENDPFSCGFISLIPFPLKNTYQLRYQNIDPSKISIGRE